MVFPGWTVARAIPTETLAGLITGQYKLHGGVIRWAAGTPYAGQIVKHLVPVGSNLIGSIPGLDFIPGILAELQIAQLKDTTKAHAYQLMQMSGQIQALSQTTQQVLNMATGAAVLSGLGLAVSSIGFATINKKLSTIDRKLKAIQQDTKAIKSFLESSERAKLYAALNALLKIDLNTAVQHRHTILHTSRNTLSEINMRYRELLSEAETMETAMTYEEYFALTSLGQVRCTAELGMLEIAKKEVEEGKVFWQTQARRIAKEILIGKYPERFLATDFVDDVSVAELIQWLDFTHEENKGLGWIDELRRDLKEDWYMKNWLLQDRMGLNQNKGIGLEKERQMLIPAMRKLVARNSIFEGYVAQHEVLASQQLKPSEFARKVATVPESASVDGYLILEPATPPSSSNSPSWLDRWKS